MFKFVPKLYKIVNTFFVFIFFLFETLFCTSSWKVHTFTHTYSYRLKYISGFDFD